MRAILHPRIVRDSLPPAGLGYTPAMKPRSSSPRKLDIGAFIESGEPLAGATPVTDLPRLAESLSADTVPAGLPPVSWTAQGRLVAQRVGEPHYWLDLSAEAHLTLECQRCLGPVTLPVQFERAIRFVKDEDAAAALDADSDDDVLALARHFDLLGLIEDELIMAQPIVPRHDTCPTDVASFMVDESTVSPSGVREEPAEQGGETPGEAGGKPNPFAVLAALKKSGK
jgi:uncharacterized protein